MESLVLTINGTPVGSGGGGGSSTAWDPTWTTIFNKDFSTLSDEDVLPGGDGDITVDGKTWYARNVSKMLSLDVGSTHGGLKMGIDSAVAACQYHEGTFTGPGLELKLAHLFTGTDFEDRQDVELRVTSDVRIEGTPATPVTEYWSAMMRSPTYDANIRASVVRGGDNTNAGRFRAYAFEPGALVYGDSWLEHTDLAYFPNLLRFSYLENFLKTEYSSSASASIGDEDLINWLCYQRIFEHQKLRKLIGDTKELQFALGYSKPSGGTGGVSAVILRALRVEARLSPAGVGVFVP